MRNLQEILQSGSNHFEGLHSGITGYKLTYIQMKHFFSNFALHLQIFILVVAVKAALFLFSLQSVREGLNNRRLLSPGSLIPQYVSAARAHLALERACRLLSARCLCKAVILQAIL